MNDFIITLLTQSLTFLPLALGISISYHILRATDMTLDGSFVLGAAVFARLITMGFSPSLALMSALGCGAIAGILTAFIQRGGRVDPLLAGILATFILSSVNLVIMGKPNIGLLSQTTLISAALAKSELFAWFLVGCYSLIFCGAALVLLTSRFGLLLRAFGDNPSLLKRLAKNIEFYRFSGFALTNTLAAAAGCLTAQTVGYADIGMGFGMTLTGIGAIILGQQIVHRMGKINYFRIGTELVACLFGVLLYFFSLNMLLRLDINPLYLKMILGIVLIVFLRAASRTNLSGNAS